MVSLQALVTEEFSAMVTYFGEDPRLVTTADIFSIFHLFIDKFEVGLCREIQNLCTLSGLCRPQAPRVTSAVRDGRKCSGDPKMLIKKDGMCLHSLEKKSLNNSMFRRFGEKETRDYETRHKSPF